MCGIAGVVSPRGFHARALKRLNEALTHRGPDDEGYLLVNFRSTHQFLGARSKSKGRYPELDHAGDGLYQLGFGHQRLAIVDLSDAGHQPMSYRGRYWITYNGEVYNYLELRTELTNLGHVFLSKSDTEVILAAYAQWGPRCFERFNGMWAIAIYDADQREVVLSRDRFGVKPLYISECDNALYFASEIKALRRHARTSPSVERARSFVLTGVVDNRDETFFSGISRFPAGCYAVINIDELTTTTFRFYDLERSVVECLQRNGPKSTDAANRARFGDLFEDAVSIRLRSDVPVGTCLSGGIDSAAIAATAGPPYRQSSNLTFNAVTGISTQQDNDESAYAQLVSAQLELRPHTVAPTYSDFAHGIEEVIQCQDEPFGGASIVMQYFVMQLARRSGLPVLLDGQGGDEILGGYAWHYGPWFWEQIRSGKIAHALLQLRAIQHSNAEFNSSRQLAKFLLGNLSPSLRYWYQRRACNCIEADGKAPHEVLELTEGAFSLLRSQLNDILRTNLPALLRFEDRNSMSFGIETRLPFLDYRLVEFGLSQGLEFKIRKGWSKWALRDWAKSRLPDEVVWRKKKLGFPAPDRDWASQHRTHMVEEISKSQFVMAVCGSKAGRLSAWLSDSEPAPFWRLYCVALWHRLHFP